MASLAFIALWFCILVRGQEMYSSPTGTVLQDLFKKHGAVFFIENYFIKMQKLNGRIDGVTGYNERTDIDNSDSVCELDE